jgi:hypothetical protein
VRAACPYGFASPDSNRVGEFEFALTRNAYNVVALPLQDSTLVKAEDLGAATGATEVSRWVAATQSFDTRIVGVVGANFNLRLGGGYFLYTPGSGPTIFTTLGNVPAPGSVTFTPVRGASCKLNLISVPLNRSDLTSADLLANSIGGVPEISDWRSATGSFRTRTVGIVGTNFAVKIGYPYWPCADTSGGGVTWP